MKKRVFYFDTRVSLISTLARVLLFSRIYTGIEIICSNETEMNFISVAINL